MEKKEVLALISILVLASFFRLWKLNEIPPGLYPDVAINGNEAFFSLKNKNFKVFYPENYGREGLMMWLIAISFYLFGVSIWSIKIVASAIGILTVFGLYLLTKELFHQSINSNQQSSILISILSSFFLATSFWHTHFSRIGFRVILLPFVLVFSFYFLFKAIKRRKIFDSVLAGIFFGFGFYTYTSFRMAVLILPIFLLFWFLYKKEEKKKFLQIFAYFLITTFFVALPIGIYFLKNPEYFVSRAAPVTIFSAKNPVKEFLKSFILHLAMFNFYGDQNWRHNFAGKPMLSFSVGILFLIGLILAIKNSLKFKENLQFAICNLQLIIWFLVMLLPGILTREGIPHSLRVAGVIPPVFIFAGMGANLIFEKIKKIKKYSHILQKVGILILIFTAFFEGYQYFFVWAKKPEVKSEFTLELVEMGNYLNSLPEDVEKYVIVNKGGVPVSWAGNLPMPSQTIMFLEISKFGEIKSKYLFPNELENIKIEKRGVILIIQEDKNIFDNLSILFPQDKLEKEKNFWIYKINF